MSLELSVTEAQGVRIHAIQGRLDSATAGDLEKSLQGLYAEPGTRAIVDLTKLDYISSAGLRVMLMLAKRAKQSQGRLVLCGLSPQVREVFEISGFTKILEMAADQPAALDMLA
jgi:anti-anti-sigma factor